MRKALCAGAGLLVLVSVASAQAPDAARAGASNPLEDARLEMRDRNWKTARALYREALDRDPKSPVARFGLAAASIQLKEYGEAREILTAMLREFPDSPEIRNNLAWICLRAPGQQDLPAAKRYAQEAVFLSPNDYNAWSTLGEVYFAQGNPLRALRAGTMALEAALAAGETDVFEYRNLVRRARVALGLPAGEEPAAGGDEEGGR